MTIFAILAILTLASAVAAITLRRLVHCALALALALAGLAAIYLQLDAQFIAFAQVLIYVGAVSILIVFAILLTRGKEPPHASLFSPSWAIGVVIAAAVFGVLGGMVLSSNVVVSATAPSPRITVRQIGEQLMASYVLPLEVLGLLLTAGLIGAVLIALQEKEAGK